ncbi:hypothetical protein [Candidatus Hepatobacter penaei]|uniref:hypothetical protein n=1 Tax=Candidatus Hepatobacter penaei TaxID=1274402 RepID=UPI0012E08B75|nr:hypothetical protein [Candidatus Hepatobacter penaei]
MAENTIFEHDTDEVIRRVYNTTVAQIVKSCKEANGDPTWILNVKASEKDLTSSDLDNFKDAIYCYHMEMRLFLDADSGRAMSASSVRAAPAIFYARPEDTLRIQTAFGKKMNLDLEIVKIKEVDGKKNPLLGYNLKNGRIERYRERVGDSIAFTFAFDKLSYRKNKFDEEGNKTGVEEEFELDFNKGTTK